MGMAAGLLVVLGAASLATTDAPVDSLVLAIREQAVALKPLVGAPLARRFLDATAALPPRREPRTPDGRGYYGTPLSYARPLEIVGLAGLESVAGERILDFGYGRIGHLWLLASLGAEVVGVDVDPKLLEFYGRPEDQGDVPGFDGRGGSLRLVHGSFPGDAKVRAAVGDGYGLVVSRNTLKGGSDPERRAAESKYVDLGLADSVFVREILACLRPGGWFLMYTLSTPDGNGRSPFPEAMLRAAGFHVVAFDRDDSPIARAMRSAQFATGGSSRDDLIGTYTLARRPDVMEGATEPPPRSP